MLWSLSPLLAIALLAWAQVRILRRGDERERLTQLGAMAFGFGVVIVVLAAIGVLQGASISNPVQLSQIAFGAGIVAWVCALAVSERQGS